MRDMMSSSSGMRQMDMYRSFRASNDLNELFHTVSKIGQDIAAASQKGKGLSGSQKKKKAAKGNHAGLGSKKKKVPESVTDETLPYNEGQETDENETNIQENPTDDKKQKYRLSCDGGPAGHGTAVQDMQAKSESIGGVPSCNGKEMTPRMLREAILWSEVLGEPAAKKRQRKRVNQRNGNESDARRG